MCVHAAAWGAVVAMVRNVQPNPYEHTTSWWDPLRLANEPVAAAGAAAATAADVLSPELVSRWLHDGFVVVDNLWPEALVAQAMAEAMELHPEAQELVRARGRGGMQPGRGFSEMPWTTKGEKSPDMALNLMTVHPRVLSAVSQLLATPVSNLRLSQSHVIAKAGVAKPGGGGEHGVEIMGDQVLFA
eukprot:COSAG01_NODE_152_length_23937_cov_122.193976_5_plen_187_part_00